MGMYPGDLDSEHRIRIFRIYMSQWRDWEGLSGDLLGKVLVSAMGNRFSMHMDEECTEEQEKEVANQLVEWYKLASASIRFLMANGPLHEVVRNPEDTLVLTAHLMGQWLEHYEDIEMNTPDSKICLG